jgi:uncharacterized membrane protein
LKAVSNANDATVVYATGVIVRTVKDENPKSVQELVDIVNVKLNMPKQEILELILKLREDGKIKLRETKAQNYGFVLSLWYVLTILTGLITFVLVYAVPLDAYPWIYFRNFFGLLFIFFIPGYAFARMVMPKKSCKASLKSLDKIELVVLSVCLSIALVSVIGLGLYYSPFNLSLNSTVFSLFLFTMVFATVALVKERYFQR